MRTLKLALLLTLVTALACGPKPGPPRPEPRYYDGLKESLEGLDLESLEGRCIVIDPGHGGVFRGAVGPGGLDEADANLGVALYLWGLLQEAGAEAILTRTTDRDFVEGDSLALRADLDARAAIANRAQADLFMSLHHNADFARDSTRNEIQVYYRMTDTGPSRDLARIIARHLRKNIGEPKTRVLAGNYRVLRMTEAPAVLCEPSFISNPRIESKLKLSDKQRLEAEIYFISLVDYFSRGVPEVEQVEPRDMVETALPAIRVTFAEGSRIDPASVWLELEGRILTPVMLDHRTYLALPQEPLAGGTHRARAGARSLGGNSAPIREWEFGVDLEPVELLIDVSPDPTHRAAFYRIRARLIDHNGNPVADGTEVALAGYGTRSIHGGTAAWVVERESLQKGLSLGCGDLGRDLSPAEPTGEPCFVGFVEIGGSGEGLSPEGFTVTLFPSGRTAVTDRHGFFAFSGPETFETFQVTRPGFRTIRGRWDGAAEMRVRAKPLFPGLPPGFRVCVDPRGGGSETGRVGPTGLTSAELNLMVALELAGFLRAAGIDAYLTRSLDRWLPSDERVRRCEERRSELVISVSHAGTDPQTVSIGHYPGSRGGIAASAMLTEELGGLDLRAAVGETAEYLIQQTSCPAVRVTFGMEDTPEGEERASRPYEIWRRAYALGNAALRHAGVSEDTFSLEGRVTLEGEPTPNAYLMVEGALRIPADSSGRFRIGLLEATGRDDWFHLEAFCGERRSGLQSFGPQTGAIEISF
jgi:N-acetylmuramoyl-L-alanine amidase